LALLRRINIRAVQPNRSTAHQHPQTTKKNKIIMSKTIPIHIDIDITVSEVDESITSQEMVNRFIDAIRDKLFHLNNNPDFG